MKDIVELYVYLSIEEKELLMFKYKDVMAMKFALSRMLNREIEDECNKIQISEAYYYRNSTIETDTDETSEKVAI